MDALHARTGRAAVTPESFLADLPGWEDARLSELHGGLTNRVWKVTAGAKVGVLKIDDEARDAPLISRCDEAYVQNLAAGAGLAANVIHADRGVFLSEYVEGTVWTAKDLENEANLRLLAKTLRQVHSLPLTGRTFDAKVAARRYAAAAAGIDATTIALCAEVVNSMRRPLNLCCCHNDLVAENILSTPELKLIDWEYATDNDPFFDLATVIEHHQLSDAHACLLLDTYLGGDSLRWRSHLAGQRKLYLALLCLWMASQSDVDETALADVSARVATRCS